jgi:DNA helicase II / ATP-dependent DNA helicase PcrA
MNISPYQQQILDWVKNGTGHATCHAVAGSGKSTTLILAANTLIESGINPRKVKILVFGKTNADELIQRFGQGWKNSISTIHAVGWLMLKAHLNLGSKAKIDNHKYQAIAYQLNYFGSNSLKKAKALESDRDLIQLVNLIRCTNNLPTSNAIAELADQYAIPNRDPEAVAEACDNIMEAGIEQAKTEHIFDFTDQIWLPVYWKASAPKRDFVMLDEAQDLNNCQTELAIALAGSKGRILGVGDPFQSVFGFAGADHNSYTNFRDRLKATELPLSICYRCPTSHINLVNKVFPKIPIESSLDAQKGKVSQVETLSPEKGDIVIARKSAPLVRACIKLISDGVAATVKGKDIGTGLKAEAEAILFEMRSAAKLEYFSYSRLSKCCYEYLELKAEKWSGLPNSAELLANLYDKLQTLMTIADMRNFGNMGILIEYIEQIFSDGNSAVNLCTVHRAKGLEADRVWIIDPSSMPQVWKGQKEWQKTQEENLIYVALTRAKKELFIVGDAKWLMLDSIHDLKARKYDVVLGGNNRKQLSGDMVMSPNQKKLVKLTIEV